MPIRCEITPRERIAAEKYLAGIPLARALVEAGYSPKYDHVGRWLKSRHIVAYLRKRKEEICLSANLDKHELVAAARRILSENKYDRIKALEILMRLCVPEAAEEVAVSSDKKSINISFALATKPEKE